MCKTGYDSAGMAAALLRMQQYAQRDIQIDVMSMQKFGGDARAEGISQNERNFDSAKPDHIVPRGGGSGQSMPVNVLRLHATNRTIDE
jgi:hypothetical protein